MLKLLILQDLFYTGLLLRLGFLVSICVYAKLTIKLILLAILENCRCMCGVPGCMLILLPLNMQIVLN